jgi:hypothetical protein
MMRRAQACSALLLAATAAQVCGWYLLIQCPACPSIPWRQVKAFDTVAACEAYREDPQRKTEEIYRYFDTICVTSNDPRLVPSPKR